MKNKMPSFLGSAMYCRWKNSIFLALTSCKFYTCKNSLWASYLEYHNNHRVRILLDRFHLQVMIPNGFGACKTFVTATSFLFAVYEYIVKTKNKKVPDILLKKSVSFVALLSLESPILLKKLNSQHNQHNEWRLQHTLKSIGNSME